MFKFSVKTITLYFAVFSIFESTNSSIVNKTSCELIDQIVKRSQLVNFRLKIQKNEINIRELPIISRNLRDKNIFDITDHKCNSVIGCPSKTVLRFYPNQFPFHSVEEECLCNGCLSEINTVCLPNVEFIPVLDFDADKCTWVEKLRPVITGCQCTFTRQMNIF